jgi:uncharacterized protein (TIGR01777 family)
MSEHRRKVVVAGGSGFIGSALVPALRADGWEVVVLTRRARRDGEVEWDGRTQGPWARELDGAEGVVNLAGESIGSGRWTRARKERILASRVDATRAIVTALGAAMPRPRVLVNASGIDFGGDRGDEIVTEEVAPGSSFLARVCAEWEAAAREACALGVRTVTLRTPLVIGREAQAVKLMALPFRAGFGGPLGDGEQWFPWVHVDDWVALCRRALVDESLRGPVNAVAPEQLRQRQAARAFGRVLHRPAVMPTPAPALRLLLGEQADLLLHGQRARSEKLNGFGFRYATLESALEEALR